jgi:hypothetical protein
MSDQPLSDTALNYQSPPPDRPTGKRMLAWISLLVMGILYFFAGLCVGGGVAVASVILLAARPGAGMPAGAHWVMVITAMATIGLPWAVAAVYVWCAFLVRRGSRAAAVASLVIAPLNALAFLGIVVGGMAMVARERGARDPGGAMLAFLFYLLPAVANAYLAIALILFLREKPPPAYRAQ